MPAALKKAVKLNHSLTRIFNKYERQNSNEVYQPNCTQPCITPPSCRVVCSSVVNCILVCSSVLNCILVCSSVSLCRWLPEPIFGQWGIANILIFAQCSGIKLLLWIFLASCLYSQLGYSTGVFQALLLVSLPGLETWINYLLRVCLSIYWQICSK